MSYQPGKKTTAGYLALPPSGAGPGILLLHAWWGLNEFFVELCDRFAAEGYVALAPDLFDGAVAATVEEATALRDEAEERNYEATHEKGLRALDSLCQHPGVQGDSVGVLGCSLGVWWALQLSVLRPEQVAAAVLFYGVAEADYTLSRCAYLGHFAENDVFDSLDDARAMVAAMRAAGRDITFFEYPGAGHWFFESNRPEDYDAESARLAWDRTVSFLNGHLRP
ncbi:MAG TPA: dienelactone hydrolase family protein [Armatimonadota bacterium]